MYKLKPYEKEVIEKLTSEILSRDTIEYLKHSCEIKGFEITENGYFIEIENPRLPYQRIVCDKPNLIGEWNGIQTGFVIFIEKNQLLFECHGWGDVEIPKNYRDLDVRIIKDDKKI